MIIILEPQKDTYVTNLKTQNNDGSLANVGHAATLDLFKLYNENKYAKSWAAFKFIGDFTGDAEMVLIDVDGNEVTFIIKVNANTANGSIDVNGKVIIGVSGANSSNQAARFADTINNVSSFNNDLTLNMTAYSNSNNELILKQNKSGDSGDTTFTLPANMEHIGTDATSSTITKFARIDYSAALIKFDLTSFKSNWVTLIDDQGTGGNTPGDGIDDGGGTKGDLPGAFKDLEAELILKDVTTGISKPKDYTLEVYSFKKDFDEGIGKDTIYFSDKDSSSFTTLDDSNVWNVAEYVSVIDEIPSTTISTLSDTKTPKGDEDLSFDITAYIKAEIIKSTISDKGFLIKFPDSILYDQKSYFVKRLGSRHLINKQFVPQLRIKIDDAVYNIPTSSFNKVRYLDGIEDFYLFNRSMGKLVDFIAPAGSQTLKFKISSKDNKTRLCSVTANSTSSKPIVNFKGEKLVGVRKAELTSASLSKFDNAVEKLITNNKLEANYEWYWSDETNTATTVTAGNFVVGRRYKILSPNTTDFTLIGSANSTTGTIFTATGTGTGTGTAYELEKTIVSGRVDFYTSENANETRYENLITSIRITENDLFANDGTNSVEVYFVDTKKEFNAVKVPYELPSENLGDVYYQVYDIETGNILVDYDIPATKMFYDGEKYKFNLFVPKLFKNLRVNFKFKYKDPITNVDKFIFSDKYSVRIA